MFFIRTYFRRVRHSAEVSADALFDAFIKAMWSSVPSSNSTESSTSGGARRRSAVDPYGVSTEPVSAVVAKGLVSFTWRRFPWLHPGEQHDAQEFLRCFLNELHDALKTVDMRSVMGLGGEGRNGLQEGRHRKKRKRKNCCEKSEQFNSRTVDRTQLRELAKELLGKFFIYN